MVVPVHYYNIVFHRVKACLEENVITLVIHASF